MDGRDLEGQLALVGRDVDASPYFYGQGFLARHPHINLRHSFFVFALYPRQISLAYAHNQVAVIVALTSALDTVGAVEAKREEGCRLLSDGHVFGFVCFIMNGSQHYFHGAMFL